VKKVSPFFTNILSDIHGMRYLSICPLVSSTRTSFVFSGRYLGQKHPILGKCGISNHLSYLSINQLINSLISCFVEKYRYFSGVMWKEVGKSGLISFFNFSHLYRVKE